MKINWLSDSPLTCTGYADQTRSLLNRLSERGHICHCQGHNYIGQVLPPGTKFEDGNELKFRLSGMGRAQYCQDLIVPTIRAEKPDIFGILLDTFMLYPWFTQLDLAPARSVFYFPSDGGGGLPQGCEEILRKVDMPIAMSKFAQKQAWDVHKVKTEYIPHGIDASHFYPLTPEERIQLKIKAGLHDKFVIGTVARNQGRKMMDRTIKAFAQIKDDIPEAVLYLHTDPTDAAQVFDIQFLIRRLNLENKVIFSGMKYFKGFDYSQMNNVYNLMDVFLLTTSGEGFGIPTVEAMSAGVPPIVTDYTTTQELLVDNGKCGIPIKLQTEVTGNWSVERGISDIDHTADSIQKLYKSPDLINKYATVGREKALKYYDWRILINKWETLFQTLINK